MSEMRAVLLPKYINWLLTCSDPAAFQWLSKHQSIRNGCRFVDLDFPDLIAKKADVIINTPELQELIDPLEVPSSPGGWAIRSENYVALGCDLVDISRLDDLLAESIDRSRSLILCIAEVSMTYMDVKAADALIEWAAQYNNSMRDHPIRKSSNSR